MISIKALLNLLVLLTLAQFYNYFSFLRFHLFIIFILVVILGIVVGCYLAFRTNEFILPSLEPRLTRPYRATKNDHLDDLVSYKTYSDLINYLNGSSPTTDGDPSFAKYIESNGVLARRRASNSLNINDGDCTRKTNSLERRKENGKSWPSGFENDLDLELGSAENLNSIDEDADDMGDLLSLDEDNQSQSNSKVETYLDELIELFVRDYIMSWLEWLIWDKDKFSAMARNEFRQLSNMLRKRLRRLDYVKLASRDLIYRFNQHFLAVKRTSNMNEPFKLNYYEMDADKEKDHLRNITEIFLLNTFPERSYFRNNAARYIIRELLVNLVWYPTLELVCDPDFLNQKILEYMATRENVRNNLNNKFSHAATYEDFIRLIKSSNNVDELKQLHFKIMNEIMQATIISEFKASSKPAHLDHSSSAPNLNNGVITCGSSSFFASFSVPKPGEELDHIGGYFLGSKSSSAGSGGGSSGEKTGSSTKAEALRSRNLKIYIKQLRYAKLLCERRLNRLNNANGTSKSSMFYDEDTNDLSFETKLKNRKIVPIDTILSSSKGLSNFLKYLEHDGSDRLLRFWIDVEKLKRINAKKKYELANKIYEIYLNTYDSPVRDEIGKDLNKSMQLFLIGNNTDEGFYKAQEKIKSVLEYDHYPSFIVTDLYEKALEHIHTEAKNEPNQTKKSPNMASSNNLSVKVDERNQLKRNSGSIDPNKVQVESLNEKLAMKLSALNAFKLNGYQQCDSKLVEVLKNDIEKLKHDISIYETHIQKTELWCDNIGKWKTKVVGIRQPNISLAHSVSLGNMNSLSPSSSLPPLSPSSSGEACPLFEIHVELRDEAREGWVIYRSYRQFETLNESLIELIPSEIKTKFKRIPSGALKKNYTKPLEDEKARQITAYVDEYLQMICAHESLAQSEALYTFLCPSPDYFKRSNSVQQSNGQDEKFSIGSIFKILKQKDINSAEDDEYLDRLFSESYLKSLDSTNTARDSIAEPFYYLFEELFEMKGVKKILRKSFILFVQLTYGANINRMIRERVYSLVLSDEYVSFYLKQLKDAYWQYDEKTGQHTLIPFTPIVRTNEEKLKTKKLAKLKLIANIPEILSRLIGDKNSQIGVIKLFELFQDKQLNKHLAYSVIEMFMMELFPEAQLNKQPMVHQ